MTAPRPAVGDGARVRLEYRVLLADGTVVEESGQQPLEIRIGGEELPAAIQRALHGMVAGETGAFEFAPYEVWGPGLPELIQVLPAEDFAEGPAPQPDQVMVFNLPDGREVEGTVLETSPGLVKVDFNHPLYNRSIRVDVRILSVEPAE